MQLKKALQVILDQKNLIEQQEKKIDWLQKTLSDNNEYHQHVIKEKNEYIKELMEQWTVINAPIMTIGRPLLNVIPA